ncbi:hypothetical protein LSH36_442g03140 [Paralvinella palmiformis]|uniref:RWD domain-containing protein n=1 Tax=Paralvinella palmiformis TaxID=53620 RepID=A0AAD9JCC4_9ANNE|nr:hypothetical protein LSH36_442g03140 [Paralvinella palmiformis]
MADDNLDNIERQIDEIEALSSIYGDKCRVIDEASRIYTIEICDNDDKPKLKLTLQIQFPDNYPGEAPPQYELSTPWLRGPERQALCSDLENIYLKNCGESIVFLWAEHLREFLTSYKSKPSSKDNSLTHTEGSPSSPEQKVSSEEEEKFDSSLSTVMAACSVVPDAGDGANIQCPEIHHGEIFKDRKSTFQAHLAKVTHPKQIDLVMESHLQNKKYAEATHNIQAYRIMTEKNGRPITYQGCHDDGEIHAGSRMLHLLQIIDATNVHVIVTRWYGGIHLGPDRFKHINNLTREILLEHGFIKSKEEKKGPKSSKKGRRS